MAAPIHSVFIPVPAELVAAKAVSSSTAESSGFKRELNHAAQRESAPKYSSDSANKDHQNSQKIERSALNEEKPAPQTTKSSSHLSAQDTNQANGLSREAQRASAKNFPTSDNNTAPDAASSNEHFARSAGKNLPLEGQLLPQPQTAAAIKESISQQLSSEAPFDKTALDVEISKLYEQVAASQLAVPLTQMAAELVVTQQENTQPSLAVDGALAVIGQATSAGNSEVAKDTLLKVSADLQMASNKTSGPAQVVAIPAVARTDALVAPDQLNTGVSTVGPNLSQEQKSSAALSPLAPEVLAKTAALNTAQSPISALNGLDVNGRKPPDLLAKTDTSNAVKSPILALNGLDAGGPKPPDTLMKAQPTNVTTALSNLQAEAPIKPSSIALDPNTEKFAADAARIQPAKPEIALSAKLVPLNVNSAPALIERSTAVNAQPASAVLPGTSASESDQLAPSLNKVDDSIARLKLPVAVVDAKLDSPLNLIQNTQPNTQQVVGQDTTAANNAQGAQASIASLVKNETALKQSQLQALATVVSESSTSTGQSNTANTFAAQAFAPQPLVPANAIANPAISGDVNLINQQSDSLNKVLDKMRAGIDTTDSKGVQETVDSKSTLSKAVNTTEGLQQLSSLHTALRNASPVQMQMPLSTPPSNPNWARAVADKVYIAASQNLRVANIQLDPPELGALQIRLQVTGPDQQMSVTFTSPHASVRDVLEQQIPRLREMLAEQGINLGESSVNDQGKDKKQTTSGSENNSSDGYAKDSDLENPEHSLNTQGTLALVDFYA